MDLSMTESEITLKETAGRFMETYASKETLLSLDDEPSGFTPTILNRMIEEGRFGSIIPIAYGGQGHSFTETGVLFEAFGKGPLPGPCFSSAVLSSLIIMEGGTKEDKKMILPAMAEGKMIVAPAVAEPDYGWDAESVRMKGTSRQDGFRLQGVKLFVPDADGATHLLCPVVTEKTMEHPEGISLFLIEKQTPKIRIRRLGGWISGLYEVVFDDALIPLSALIGEQGKGGPGLNEALLKASAVLCAYMTGGCRAVVDRTLSYSQTRIQFGTPIGRFQRVQDHILQMVDYMDTAYWTAYQSLWKLDSRQDARESIHTAKMIASRAYYETCTLSHHVHGGLGLDFEQGLTLHTRMSRFLYAYLGDPVFHRKKLASLLGFENRHPLRETAGRPS